jgi:uncharacterized SAM-binding protein YcdF (DUF218 family)
MIYLHKTLPLFFSPLMVIIFLILFGLILRKTKLIWLALTVLVVGSLPIVASSCIKFLEGNQARLSADEAEPADAIVVLGGMLTSVRAKDKIHFEWLDPDRFFGGIELAKKNKAHYLIFTGGKLPWERNPIDEGVFLKKEALIYGVDINRILLTSNDQNTEEEVLAIKKLLEDQIGVAGKKIILVTSAFHMSRAQNLFEENGVTVIPYPVDFRVNISDVTPMSFLPSAYSLKDIEFSLRELMGRFYYSIRRLFLHW